MADGYIEVVTFLKQKIGTKRRTSLATECQKQSFMLSKTYQILKYHLWRTKLLPLAKIKSVDNKVGVLNYFYYYFLCSLNKMLSLSLEQQKFVPCK